MTYSPAAANRAIALGKGMNAARDLKARASNPYSQNNDRLLRNYWFQGYDRAIKFWTPLITAEETP